VPAALRLTAAQARRTAIAAQGLAAPLPEPSAPRPTPHRGHLRRAVEKIGLLQIDSVNVLARAHYLPLFARLGSYPMELLADAAWPRRPADRMLLETWAHEASLIPVEQQPLLRWRQQQRIDGPWSSAAKLRAEHPGFLEDVLAVVRDAGPVSAGEIEKLLDAPGRGRPGWWEWSATKIASEYLFGIGAIGTATRRGFERVYDLTERIVPPAVLASPTPDEADAKRDLVERSARAHGIGTVADLADYYRISTADTRRAVSDLVEAGALLPVAVQGWRDVGYLHHEAKMPRRVGGRALLCPFDPLVWRRDRTERLFDFRYRIEIYTPVHKRVHGYYVFPFLMDDALAARFDLKADRAAGHLLVQASWYEERPGAAAPAAVAQAAAVELRRMAGWLKLTDVVVVARGDLAEQLAAAVTLLR
jgi:uncharacterized protein YcaQ